MMAIKSLFLPGCAGSGRIFILGLACFVLPASVSSQALATNPGRFSAMTCQQLWYLEQKSLAEGRVCLKSERAKRAFRRADRCISSSEGILPEKTQDYLKRLRKTARSKRCAGF